MEVQQVEASQTQEVESAALPVNSEPQQGEVQNDGQENSQKPDGKTPEWAERRFRKLTEQKYEARMKAELAERRAAELEARLSAYEGQQQPRQEVEDPYKIAEQIAAQKLRAKEFNQKADSVVELGGKEFKDEFAGAVTTLHRLGALFDDDGTPTDFAESVMDYEQPHKILHFLGTNPYEAERILGMSPRAQARELAKLEMKLSQPAEPKVSKAPPPVKPVGAKASSDAGPSDKDSIADWMKKRQAELKKR